MGGWHLIAAGTAPAPTADTLDGLLLLELRFRHPANTGGIEIGLFGLDAAKTAQL